MTQLIKINALLFYNKGHIAHLRMNRANIFPDDTNKECLDCTKKEDTDQHGSCAELEGVPKVSLAIKNPTATRALKKDRPNPPIVIILSGIFE